MFNRIVKTEALKCRRINKWTTTCIELSFLNSKPFCSLEVVVVVIHMGTRKSVLFIPLYNYSMFLVFYFSASHDLT